MNEMAPPTHSTPVWSRPSRSRSSRTSSRGTRGLRAALGRTCTSKAGKVLEGWRCSVCGPPKLRWSARQLQPDRLEMQLTGISTNWKGS
jgi:hypothetical protein